MIEKYTFDIQAPRCQRKIVLVKSDSENRIHIALKLMAFILFYEEDLKVEVSIGMHYKPDLVVMGENQNPKLWIDCGYVSVKKATDLAKKLKKTRIILVKKTNSEIKHFSKHVEKKSDYPEHIEYLSFDPGFIQSVADHFKKKNEITVYDVMEDTIGVVVNEDLFETQLYR